MLCLCCSADSLLTHSLTAFVESSVTSRHQLCELMHSLTHSLTHPPTHPPTGFKRKTHEDSRGCWRRRLVRTHNERLSHATNDNFHEGRQGRLRNTKRDLRHRIQTSAACGGEQFPNTLVLVGKGSLETARQQRWHTLRKGRRSSCSGSVLLDVKVEPAQDHGTNKRFFFSRTKKDDDKACSHHGLLRVSGRCTSQL